MELRLLTGETERKIFADRVEQVRARHGNGFKERPRSRLAEIHLSFGNLYALFENDGDPAEEMVAGLMMHDLEMFPQTCPRPDLSHLPPRSVLEIGELWSRSMGAGAGPSTRIVSGFAARARSAAIFVAPSLTRAGSLPSIRTKAIRANGGYINSRRNSISRRIKRA